LPLVSRPKPRVNAENGAASHHDLAHRHAARVARVSL
jgi:hypothetical protein